MKHDPVVSIMDSLELVQVFTAKMWGKPLHTHTKCIYLALCIHIYVYRE